MIAVNLIPVYLRETAVVRRRIRRWVIGGGAFAASLGAACGLLQLLGGQEHSRLSEDGGRLAERIAAAEASLNAVRAQVQEHARRLEASQTVGTHPDWSVLLGALAEQRGEDIIFQNVDLRAVEVEPVVAKRKEEAGPAGGGKSGAAPARRVEMYRVQIKGFGLSQGDVVRFVRRLEELGPLVGVELKESRAEVFQGVPAVSFDAECRLTERRTERADAEKAP